MGVFDVVAVRKQFPALDEGAAHFDGPGGSQTPQVVADAVADHDDVGAGEPRQLTAAERRADEIVVAAREAMADLLGTDPRGIVFGRSMTQLTYDFSRTLAKTWAPGDEVIVTRLDHDANVRPWVQAAEAVGATDPLARLRHRDRPSSTTSRRCSPTAPGWSRSPARPTCSAPDPTLAGSPTRSTRPARCCTSTACT